MRKMCLAAAALLVACSPAVAPAQPLKAGAPKLVVAIAVDQLSSDLWDAYRPHFRGGLARLAGGTVYRNGYQSHAATETCPGHSTILTGKRPATNGIVANTWLDQSTARADKTIYCAEDERVPGSTSTAYTVSPVHLNAQTLGDLLKARSPASRNVAVAGKDRGAVMMSGRTVDQRWFWDGKTFSTDLKGATVPASVAAFKTALAGAIATARPPLDAPALCQAKARAYQLTPAIKVGDNRLGRAAGDLRQFRISPDLDGATLALAAALVREMGLGGGGRATDLLSLNLAATDYVGHAYGSDGMEMCLQLLALDRELGDFFGQLDRSGIDYAVVLTGDHGGMDIPERLREKGVGAAARADAGLAAAEVGKLLAPRFGQNESVLKGFGIGNDIWVNAAVPAAQRAAVLRAAKERYAQHPQVFAAYTRAEVMAVPVPTGAPDKWSILQRVRASYGPRSGDLYVVLKEYISPIPVATAGYAATHASPWDYDRRVPIVFWRKGQRAAASDRPVETVDIMPTLAAMIGLRLQRSVDGRCLRSAGSSCDQ